MALKINHDALAHARKLISEGKINHGEWNWSKSAHSPDELKKICLAEDPSATEGTKERYLYPFGAENEVYSKAIASAEAYAKKNGESALHAELVKLAEEIQKKDAVNRGQGESAKGGQRFMAALDIPVGPNGELPRRFPILPLGLYKGYIDPDTGEKRTFEITPERVRQAIEYLNSIKAKNPEFAIVIDNDHLTLMDTFAPAFGWITGLYDAGPDGLGADGVEWTRRGAEVLANKEYRFISPVFFFNGVDGESGETIPFGISSAALTNTPFFDKLKPLVAKRVDNLNNGGIKMKDLLKAVMAFLGLTDENTPETELVAKFAAKVQEVGQLVTAKKVFGDLGLPDNTTMDQAKTIVVLGSKTPAEQYAHLLEQIGFEKGTTPEAAKATVIMAKQAGTKNLELAQRVQQLEAAQIDREAIEAVETAIAEGKIFPAQRDEMLVMAKKDLAGMKAFFAKAPQVAPLKPLGEAGRTGDSKVVTDEMKEVANRLQLDPAKMAS